MAMEFEVNISLIAKCRVCFQEKDDLHSIFKRRKGASAYDRLSACTKLNIERNDGGPSLICIDCLRELEITVKFLEKCEKSNETLSALNLGIAPKNEQSIDKDAGAAADASIDERRCEQLQCTVCGVRDGCVHSQYQCHLCSKQFKRKDNLKVHRERHSGERRFWCVECGARRYTSGELAAHMRTHAADAAKARAHKCCLCHKAFTARANLRIHMRRHTVHGSNEVCLKVSALTSATCATRSSYHKQHSQCIREYTQV